MYPISLQYHFFSFQDSREKRLLKGNGSSYHHTVILSPLGLVLKRCLLMVLPLSRKTLMKFFF